MLNGSLDAFALPDVLRFVAASGVTGRVEIVRDEVGGEISLDQGRFVAARLADEQAPSTEDEALDVAVLLFDGNAGTFQVVEEEWVGGPLDLDADQLAAAVERRRQEWAEVVSVLGSLEDSLALVPSLPDGVDQVTLSAQQWRLLALVDGRRSVQDIARDSASTVYTAALQMAEMARSGLVARGGAAWEEPPAPPQPRRRAKASVAEEPDPADMLRELGGEDEEEAEEQAPAAVPDTRVRPLRTATREEQRLRLRR